MLSNERHLTVDHGTEIFESWIRVTVTTQAEYSDKGKISAKVLNFCNLVVQVRSL